MKLDFISLDIAVGRQDQHALRQEVPRRGRHLPTVRRRGILQPLIVGRNCGPDAFEILAGAQQFTAARIVRDERRAAGDPTCDHIPCAIIDDGDDDDALEASMIENMARLISARPSR